MIARDAHRRPIAVYRLDSTPAGWRLAGSEECSSYGPTALLEPPNPA